MTKIFERPHFYFFITSFLIVALGYLMKIFIGDSALVINIHDTYFIISDWHISILFSILFASIGICYWAFKIFKISMIRSLTRIHTAITFAIFIIYTLGIFIFHTTDDPSFPLFDETSKISIFKTTLIFVLIAVQIFLIINIITSLTKFLLKK